MVKFWRVAYQEYSRNVFQRRFLFALFSIPLVVLFMVGLVYLLVLLETNTTPVGYVDYSGLLADPLPPPEPNAPNRPVPFIAYPTEAEAHAALDAGELQAYYVISEDYSATGEARLVYYERPKESAMNQFNTFLGVNLLRDQPPEISERVLQGSDLSIQTVDNRRTLTEEGWFNLILPIITGVGFIVMIFSTSGYLMQAVIEEKENRTMEVVVTSVSPGQLMIGKITGDIAIGFTQLLFWILFIAAAFFAARGRLEWVDAISLPPEMILITVATMLPAFVMVAALMAAIGATVTQASEGQQISGLISLPIWIPYMLIMVVVQSPNSPLMVALSFFPLTAPLTIAMRAGFTVIPAWQILVSLTILILSAAGALWLAGRAFRLGMLRYGQRLRWREVFSRQVG